MEEKKDAIRPIDKMFELLCENEKIAGDLINVNRDLVLSNESLATDLILANKNLALENEKLTSELIFIKRGIADRQVGETRRAAERIVADHELGFQQSEKKKRAAELKVANAELTYQQGEKNERAAELVIANEELLYQQGEKEKRAAELEVANAELTFQQGEKDERAAELVIANEELLYQQGEKEKRAAELVLMNKELAKESGGGRRVADLVLANQKLAAENEELEKRSKGLLIANKDRLELLARLLQSQKLESLGTLAGGVAHDMNNVLGAILGLASAHLEIQPAESPAYRAFETIAKAAIRGGKMAKSLLSFARQSPAVENELDLNTLLREEVRLLERTTLAKVHLSMILTPDLRPIQGDASALTNAFMNLCVNAVDAMQDNGRLTLRTRNVDNDWIEVEVEDTGRGMTKEVLAKALDPFFTTKEEGKGTGLGLSLVYSTVTAHRGSMTIRSAPEQGTCVKIRFPASEPLIKPMELEDAHQSLPFTHRLQVLVVDDDDLVRNSTQTILELLGHSVTDVASGEEALEQLASGLAPEVVLLDMNMPGLGGAETLARIRLNDPDLPILLATGRVDQAALDLVGAYPNVTLLAKPFSIRALQAQLKALGWT